MRITHLTGRYNEIHLYPFSFSEYCNYHQIDTQSITRERSIYRIVKAMRV